jgi:hypothetical protein
MGAWGALRQALMAKAHVSCGARGETMTGGGALETTRLE